MTMLQIHAEALESANTTYHEFLLRYKSHAKVVYGFVEGKEDPMFYRGLIEQNLPSGWEVELVQSGCKDNVLRAFEHFDWSRFSNKRVAFFVDKDLVEFIPESDTNGSNIYITDNYSIENDAVNFGTLKRLLEEVLNINGLSPDEAETIRTCFETCLARFRDAMLPIMAQIILWRRYGTRPCLNDIKIKEFFDFSGGNLCLNPAFADKMARVQRAAECVNLKISKPEEIAAAEVEFCQKQGLQRYVRGKYLLWFLVEFALDIHSTISKLMPRFSKTPKPRLSISPTNAMTIIAPRVRCPVSLLDFLNRTYRQYIADLESAAESAGKNGETLAAA